MRAFRTGPSVVLSIHAPVSVQLEWLVQEAPDYLLTYPSNLEALAEASRRSGLKLSRLREVRTMSEVVNPELRALVREVWGVPLADAYTAQEVGYIALQCPDHEHYHVQSENLIVEVLDDEGRPCAPGESGRVVVTALHNFAMPLLRYELGDYAVAGAPCRCGRGLPVLQRILGRVRNMLPAGRRRARLAHAGRRSVQAVTILTRSPPLPTAERSSPRRNSACAATSTPWASRSGTGKRSP